MPSTGSAIAYRSWGLILCAAGALVTASVAVAADRGDRSDAQMVYQRDRAACINGQTGQERATCLREAGAALQEARRGRLDGGSGEFEKNRLLRCDRQPPEDRQDCVRRMNGEGLTSGSAEEGGIYRELVTPVVPPQRD
jgi:hypothetical protein